MSRTNYTIRKAVINDLDDIIQLCGEHAEYEKAEYNPINKKEKLGKHLFKENPSAYCLVVEVGNKLMGFATFSFEFSTWNAAFYLHMDCLFLRPSLRGLSIGAELVKTIKDFAIKYDCSLIQWQTPVFNERAINFYNKLGVNSKDKLRFYLDVELKTDKAI